MNNAKLRAQVKAELDVNKDGTVNLDDITAYMNGRFGVEKSKGLLIGFALGVACSIALAVVYRMV